MKSPCSGLTWVEVLIGLGLAVILAALALPSISGTYCPAGPLMQAQFGMRQLGNATQAFTIDNHEKGEPVQWTCSNSVPLTYGQWTNLLISGKYLTAKDLKNWLSVTQGRRGEKVTDNVLNVFAVTESDEEKTVLFSTRNWSGPEKFDPLEQPFQGRGFALYFKSGEFEAFLPSQPSDPKSMDWGGMHKYQTLK